MKSEQTLEVEEVKLANAETSLNGENKLSSEEHAKFKELNQKIYDTLLSVGDMEAAISDLTQKKAEALKGLKQTKQELAQHSGELGKKYGEKKVNIATGELS
tara:strand:+ start:127 stop:432 length:306 start_codon:yes stop_codon:yes gene_type:complete